MAEHANVYPLRREPEREPQRKREPQPEPRPRERQAQEPLWREVLGRRLRVLRQEQQETLSETAARAGISPQYLSEIERGRKEASSELLASLCAALDVALSDVLLEVSEAVALEEAAARLTPTPIVIPQPARQVASAA
jgi:DNA-binding XRE family transcriptional regulator